MFLSEDTVSNFPSVFLSKPSNAFFSKHSKWLVEQNSIKPTICQDDLETLYHEGTDTSSPYSVLYIITIFYLLL